MSTPDLDRSSVQTLREAAELLRDAGTPEYVNPPTADAMQRAAVELDALARGPHSGDVDSSSVETCGYCGGPQTEPRLRTHAGSTAVCKDPWHTVPAPERITVYVCPECGTWDMSERYTGGHDFDRNPECHLNWREPVQYVKVAPRCDSGHDAQPTICTTGHVEGLREIERLRQEVQSVRALRNEAVAARDRAEDEADRLREVLRTIQRVANRAAVTVAREELAPTREGVDRG
jgi:hypothetical protein